MRFTRGIRHISPKCCSKHCSCCIETVQHTSASSLAGEFASSRTDWPWRHHVKAAFSVTHPCREQGVQNHGFFKSAPRVELTPGNGFFAASKHKPCAKSDVPWHHHHSPYLELRDSSVARVSSRGGVFTSVKTFHFIIQLPYKVYL